MTQQEPRVVAFTIDEPFAVAERMVRRAIAREGLRVPCELTTSERLRLELGVTLRDSIVLYVDDPILLLQATVLTPAGSLYVPEPVVLAATGHKQCRVVVRSIRPLLDSNLPGSVRQAMLLLHERILKALQIVGRPETVLPSAHKGEPVPVQATL